MTVPRVAQESATSTITTAAPFEFATSASRIRTALKPLELLEWALSARLENAEEYETFVAPIAEARRVLEVEAEKLAAEWERRFLGGKEAAE